jgi:acetyl-CoA C-acetyltransferase
MKSVQWAAQSIALGDNEICVAGGMENMSLIPHYSYLRKGQKFGSQAFVDGLQEDGLNDAYDAHAMGVCADECASKYELSREAQDQYAISSYEKAAQAWKSGSFADEIAAVSVPQRRGEPLIVDHDEEYQNVRFDKIPQLRAAFSKDGTVTAANASTINDGAAAVIVMSEEKAKALGLNILAYINCFADAATAPKWFTIAPSKAIPSVLEKAALKISDIDYFEINEAFSAVALANQKILNIPAEKLNTRGGAVALGHPLGCSGTRILVTLIYTLIHNQGTYGLAGICNGGGGASAMLIERK